MINNKEVDAVTLSATKKDFYQIWNELLETAGKLSERWSPTSTNESDPGIVLLKVLTAIADKLNYNIDKNTLEAFMPSAAQEESMRKLCDMMGYNMKYYRSATTNVKIAYVGEEPLTSSTEILIDKFTNIKNSDNTVNYVTTVAKTISNTESVVVIPCIEGELVECETDDDNIISITLLDDNFRYYLPETRIAENGIFIYNINDGQVVLSDGEAEWTRVDNLNIQPIGDRVFKFGFDSALNIPYIQFPEDIATIMEDGLKIYYIRTNGVNGNISVNELSTMDEPASWSESYSADGTASAQWDKDVDFTIKNTSSATNGKNPETLKQAYNNYKKTIGTFDTLVTCRDYMNKIYQMTVSETDTTPLVSNIIVSDIRDDINNMVTICSFNDYGICYKDVSLQDETGSDKITHFDLLLYPFKTYNNLSTETDYKNSFTYSELTADEIEAGLTEYKTIAHNIRFPQNGDIACIKVYLKLKAKITTVRKVNKAEEAGVLASIYRAIYSQFNMRELDFNEEIVYDDIEKCIEDADTRIKNVLWEDPELVVKACMVGGEEYTLTGLENNSSDTDTDQNRLLYDQLLIRNILAGKIDLFEYVTDFKTDYTEAPSTAKYQKYTDPYDKSGSPQHGQIVFPKAEDTYGKLDGGADRPAQIVKLGSECKLDISGMSNTGTTDDITLGDNEVIQFRLPNFFTTVTYPNNVNYYAKLTDKENGIPADAEYKLKDDEYVLFNYTSKNTDDSGAETMDIHNIVYTTGSILRPNFDLKDSETIKAASTSTSYISWRKTSGYNFNKASATIYPTSAADSWQDPTNRMGGMFCLTTEEQIEARERVEVTLDKPFTYYYWNRNDDDEKITEDKNRSESDGSPQGYITFKFDSTTADGEASYILKDNEYFFYTDKNKLDIAFYGSGTEIVAKMSSGNSLTLIKRYNNAVDTASIVDNGLASQIPWERIDLKAETTSGAWKTLTLTEYQYVTLGTEDTLNYIKPVYEKFNELTNNWIEIDKANYTKSDGTAKQLPAIYIGDLFWEGRSRLDFNMGPEQAQILRRTDRVQDTITGYARVWTSEKEDPPGKFVEFTPAEPDTLEPTKTVTLKSNYGIQGSTDTLDVSISEYDEETDTYQPLNDFKLKLFETKSEVSEKITLNNFADHLTFIDFNELNFGDNPGEITLNTTLSDSAKYGLIMLYYSDPSAETSGETYTAGASFEITSVSDKTAAVSYFNSDNTLTPTTTGGSTYKLKLGMQIIQLKNVKSIKLIHDTAFKSTVVISDLQEVIGINPKLNYLLTSDEMAEITPGESIADAQLESVLARIKDTLGSLNDSYYYSSPIDNSSKIDLNTKLDTETMSNARTYFDYNNVNNKFVISEIDANALKNGITLASSSRQ